MPTCRSFVRLTTPLALVLLAGCAGGSDRPPRPGDLSGKYIATVADADMTAPAFLTGQLGVRDATKTDTLTVLTLPIQEPTAESAVSPVAMITVSNSVIGPPNGLAITRDAKTAFIIETRGPASAESVTVQDLPPGKHLFAVDLTEPLKPQITSALDIGSALSTGSEPVSVDVHPAGDLVAVATKSPSEQIVIVPFDGKLGTPMAWGLLGVDDTSTAPAAIAWSPDGRHLAVTLPDRDQVVFYEFTRDSNDGSLGLRAWGAPVNVGRYPYAGVFTPDGRCFITANLQWGRDVEDFRVGAPQGTLSVVRLSDIPAEIEPMPGADVGARTVVHERVAEVPVGVSPTGLAVSPDGKLVVTSNLRRSFLPEGDPRLTRGGSISLLSLDSSTGALTALDEYEMPAMPMGLTFDARGDFVVVTQFRTFQVETGWGSLGVWKVNHGKTASLTKADFSVDVGVGPHGVVIVR